MFLLFVGTSDIEQIGLELSLESVQCHLLRNTLTYLLTSQDTFWLASKLL